MQITLLGFLFYFYNSIVIIEERGFESKISLLKILESINWVISFIGYVFYIYFFFIILFSSKENSNIHHLESFISLCLSLQPTISSILNGIGIGITITIYLSKTYKGRLHNGKIKQLI